MILLILCLAAARFCDKNEDSTGTWYNTRELINNLELMNIFEAHVLGNREAPLEFHRTFVPSQCSMFRYNKTSLYDTVNNMAAKGIINKPMKILFLGDSGLRGILCAIARVGGGSEMLGPLKNDICGGLAPPRHLPISIGNPDVVYRANVTDNLILEFAYVMNIKDDVYVNFINNLMSSPPYAVVVNSGAWDFDKLSRRHPVKPPYDDTTPQCKNDDYKSISLLRGSEGVKKNMHAISKICSDHKVRIIYKNNHHNARFGALCADTEFEKTLIGSNWEVFDTKNITKDHWKDQLVDGFHYDRQKIFTEAHHARVFKQGGIVGYPWKHMGELEMQMAQSFLHFIFLNNSLIK